MAAEYSLTWKDALALERLLPPGFLGSQCAITALGVRHSFEERAVLATLMRSAVCSDPNVNFAETVRANCFINRHGWELVWGHGVTSQTRGCAARRSCERGRPPGVMGITGCVPVLTAPALALSCGCLTGSAPVPGRFRSCCSRSRSCVPRGRLWWSVPSGHREPDTALGTVLVRRRIGPSKGGLERCTPSHSRDRAGARGLLFG